MMISNQSKCQFLNIKTIINLFMKITISKIIGFYIDVDMMLIFYLNFFKVVFLNVIFTLYSFFMN